MRDPVALAPSAVDPSQVPGARVMADFVEAAARTKEVFAVLDGDAFAKLASQHHDDRPLVLLWSHDAEARRWADVLATAPSVVAIDLVTLVTSTLPALKDAGVIIGPNWTAEPIEPESLPADLDTALRSALVQDFTLLAGRNRCVWTLSDGEGVAGLADAAGEIVPVWGDRHTAARVAADLGTGCEAHRMPLMEFTSRFLLTARALKARIAPAYLPGPSPLAVTPWQFKALLTGGARAIQGRRP
jgi:hypothetical protein